jgi:hypothetical protein
MLEEDEDDDDDSRVSNIDESRIICEDDDDDDCTKSSSTADLTLTALELLIADTSVFLTFKEIDRIFLSLSFMWSMYTLTPAMAYENKSLGIEAEGRILF